MKLKLNELIATILLGVGAVLSLFSIGSLFDSAGGFIGDLFDGYADFPYFVYFIGAVSGILMTPIAIVGAILVFVRKTKFAMFGAALVLVLWILAAALRFLAYVFSGYGDSFNIFTDFFFHVGGQSNFLTGIPLFIVLFVASALLFLGEFPNKISALAPLAATLSKPLQGGAHHQQQYMPPQQQHYAPPAQQYAPPQQAAPVAPGMKKCPECAELVQPEAIKCRFCNYRFA